MTVYLLYMQSWQICTQGATIWEGKLLKVEPPGGCTLLPVNAHACMHPGCMLAIANCSLQTMLMHMWM